MSYKPETTTQGASWEQIYSQVWARRQNQSLIFRQMLQVRDHYNGDIVIPIADVKGHKSSAPMSARLVTEAIDSQSRLCSMSRPNITAPPLEAFNPASSQVANKRRKAWYARWDENALGDILLRRHYRFLSGYGSSCFVVMPDFKGNGCAKIELRNPLGLYPELRSMDDVREPRNLATIYGRSVDWIQANYPEARDWLGTQAHLQGLWDIVEWIDDKCIVIGILGPRGFGEEWSWVRAEGGMRGYELRRWRNRADMVPVAVPRRITLDRLMGITDASLAAIEQMERMVILNDIAAEKYVFPDMLIMGTDGREARLLNGTWRDGRSGVPNEMVDGEFKFVQASPGPLTNPNIDRAERNFRISTGLVPQTGGETGGAGLRTGRAIDAIGGYSVDPRVQELQEVTTRCLKVVNEAIAAVELGYAPSQKYTVFSGWPGEHGLVEYTPKEIFKESRHNVVSYSFPGTNISEISTAIGQLLGEGVMSHATARREHPLIEDPDGEERAVNLEKMTDAMFAAQLAQAQQGALPLIDQVRAMELYANGKTIWEAVQQASREAQERQAAQAPPPEAGQATAPEQQPGLALPGQGVESAAPPEITPPTPAQDNFRQLYHALTTGAGQRRGQ